MKKYIVEVRHLQGGSVTSKYRDTSIIKYANSPKQAKQHYIAYAVRNDISNYIVLDSYLA